MAKKVVKKTRKKKPTYAGSGVPQNPGKLTLKQSMMIVNVRAHGNISGACEQTGIRRGLHNNWMRAVDATYRKAFNEAMEEAGEMAMSAARKRAIPGLLKTKTVETVRPVTKNGVTTFEVLERTTTTENVVSDTLLMWLLNHYYGDPRKLSPDEVKNIVDTVPLSVARELARKGDELKRERKVKLDA